MQNTDKTSEGITTNNIQPAAILPSAAVQMLTQAGKTPIDKNPLARIKAIENAVEHIRQRYPKYFKGRG